MIFKNIDIVILFEHVSRELDSLTILHNELKKLGISSVILPIHFNRYVSTIRYKPKLVILPYIYSESNPTRSLFESAYSGVKFLNLHHEQFYNEGTKDHLLPSDNYARDIFHISWSNKFKLDLVYSGVAEKDVEVIGNPRTDVFFLKENKAVKSIKEPFEKLIFIPTTFSWALVDESYFLKIASIDPDEFKIRRQITYDAAVAYFKDFFYLSNKYPSYLFVLRPHPFEDINVFEKLFLDVNQADFLPSNVLISRDYNVYDWLKFSDLTVGWCTTVNMEAELFRCLNIIYHPTNYPENMNLEFYPFYDICQNVKDLEDYLLGALPSPEKKELLHTHIDNNFGLADGRVNARLAKYVLELISIKNNVKVKKSILINLTKSVLIDLPKNILFKLNLLHKYDSSFSGILVDNPSKKEMKRLINENENT